MKEHGKNLLPKPILEAYLARNSKPAPAAPIARTVTSGAAAGAGVKSPQAVHSTRPGATVKLHVTTHRTPGTAATATSGAKVASAGSKPVVGKPSTTTAARPAAPSVTKPVTAAVKPSATTPPKTATHAPSAAAGGVSVRRVTPPRQPLPVGIVRVGPPPLPEKGDSRRLHM